MDIKTVVKTALKDKDKTQRWLADRLEMNEKTFSGKLIGNSFSAEELLLIANILDIDLNALRSQIKPKKDKYNMAKIVLYLCGKTGNAIDDMLDESPSSSKSLLGWLLEQPVEVVNIIEQPVDDGWMTEDDEEAEEYNNEVSKEMDD